MKDVFANRKKLLLIDEVRVITVPRYDELSVKNLSEKLKNDEILMAYMPTNLAKSRTLDRTYFHNVLNTVRPEVLPMAIKHANKVRFGQAGHDDEDHQEHIVVTQQWYATLTEHPFFSSKSILSFSNHDIIE